MLYETVKSVIIMPLKGIVDLFAQFIFLFSYIYALTHLGIMAILLEFFGTKLDDYYRYIFIGMLTENMVNTFISILLTLKTK